jgi:hypothetical protein
MFNFFFSKMRVNPGASPAIPHEKRKPGDLFKQMTGVSVEDCATIDDIDATVAKIYGINGSLPFKNASSGIVIRSGDVFRHVSMGSRESLNKRIDAALNVE